MKRRVSNKVLIGCLIGLLKQNKIVMLKKIEKDRINPQRPAFTAIQTNRGRKKVSMLPPQPMEPNEWTHFNSLRPSTTPLIDRHQHETFNNTGHSSNLVHLRSISVVQSELSDRYKAEMNPYLRNKFRKIIKKKQETFVSEQSLENTIQTSELSISSKFAPRRPLEHFYLTLNNEAKRSIEKGVDEAYLLTAKERIIRLIQMKKERENQYKSLRTKISAQRMSNDQARGKNRFEQFKKQTIQQQQWDKNWREDIVRQNKRYKNRLLIKCNKQTPHFFSVPN